MTDKDTAKTNVTPLKSGQPANDASEHRLAPGEWIDKDTGEVMNSRDHGSKPDEDGDKEKSATLAEIREMKDKGELTETHADAPEGSFDAPPAQTLTASIKNASTVTDAKIADASTETLAVASDEKSAGTDATETKKPGRLDLLAAEKAAKLAAADEAAKAKPAATTQAADTEASKRTVQQVDMAKPFAILLHQTESRNNWSNVVAEDGETVAELMARVDTMAAELAIQYGRPVAVFGPQSKVKIPPTKPVADEIELKFQ